MSRLLWRHHAQDICFHMMIENFDSLRRQQPKRSLFAFALENLGSRIVKGEFPPGSLLPNEMEICAELSASRSVIREAIKSLAAKGMLEVRQKVGTRVLPQKHWNLFDLDVLGWRYSSIPRLEFFKELFEIRRMIEPQGALLAAERATEADIAELRKSFAAMSEPRRDNDSAIKADIRFHTAILDSAHNGLLSQMSPLISVGLLISFKVSNRSFDVFLKLHEAVLAAIANRNPQGAWQAMDDLLIKTREFVERELIDTERKDQIVAQTISVIEKGFDGS